MEGQIEEPEAVMANKMIQGPRGATRDKNAALRWEY